MKDEVKIGKSRRPTAAQNRAHLLERRAKKKHNQVYYKSPEYLAEVAKRLQRDAEQAVKSLWDEVTEKRSWNKARLDQYGLLHDADRLLNSGPPGTDQRDAWLARARNFLQNCRQYRI